MTSFSIQTFGCRVNQAEAFLWSETFQQQGLRYEKDFLRSDLVLINSCTLTSRADSDVKSFIRKMARLNPKAKLIVTGCYAERAPEEFRKTPNVWEIFTNTEKKDITERVLSIANKKKNTPISPFRSRAIVKVQDGCNFQCAFCIIPKVRGKSESVEKKEILGQVRKFISRGFKEVVLTGIHLCSYGLGLDPRTSLLQLLQEIEGLEGLSQVRLSSLDPRFLKPSLIEYITASKKICPHFHLSLQHGSDKILQRMGRKITVGEYQKILSDLHQNSPSASIGADIIVGFPGETDVDFSKTYHFLEQSPMTYFHVFSYSSRPGTAAASWPQENDRVKRKRASLLRDMSAHKNMSFRKRFVGMESDAIVIKKEPNRNKVLTSNYIKILVPSCTSSEKDEVRVKITHVSKGETKGDIVNL